MNFLMRNHCLSFCVAVVGLSSAGEGLAAEIVSLHLRLSPPNAIEVSYALPARCKELAFTKTGKLAAQMRSAWKALDSCGATDGHALHQNGTCRAVRFLVPVSAEKISGYPAAFPASDGVYVHTSNFAVSDSCGPLTVTFHAASIATQGKVFTQEFRPRSMDAGNMSALLLPTKLNQGDKSLTMIDPALGTENARRISQVAEETIDFFRAEMPHAPFKMPALVATLVTGPGGVRFDGDASDVLRLALFNWPKAVTPDLDRTLTRFVSHEFSHRFQLRDAVDNYPSSRLIHEGGAEFLRWTLAIKKGWLSREQGAQEINAAIGDCLMGTRGRTWSGTPEKTKSGQRLEYSCGLAVYAFGLASQSEFTLRPGNNALQRIEAFYEKLHSGEAPDFVQAIECGRIDNCTAKWLPRLLGSDDRMDSVWASLFASTGLAIPTAANTSQARTMVREFLSQLMVEDCGEASWYFGPSQAEADTVPACKTLRGGMVITKVEGRELFEGMPPLDAMLSSCRQSGRVQLELASGGGISLSCSRPYEPLETFYEVDIEKLLPKLFHFPG